MTWRIGIDKDIEIVKAGSWDGNMARGTIFTESVDEEGNLVEELAARRFLFYDDENSDIQAGYKFPLVYVMAVEEFIIYEGLLTAIRMLDRAVDIPQTTIEEGRDILEQLIEKAREEDDAGRLATLNFSSLEKAQHMMGEMSDGDLVTWSSSGGDVYGQIEDIEYDGTISASPGDVEMEGTEDNPAYLVRVWRPDGDGGWEPTDTLTVHRGIALEMIDELPESKYTPQRYSSINFRPSSEIASVARRALEWRDEYGRGGTGVGVARARDLSNRRTLSPTTIRRMRSYFARHEVDKQAEGFSMGEEGFPSAGRIAWDLWGGDPGQIWANRITEEMEAIDTKDSEDFLQHFFFNSEKGRLEAELLANFEEAGGTADINCETCWFFDRAGWCSLYDFRVHEEDICQDWKPNTEE